MAITFSRQILTLLHALALLFLNFYLFIYLFIYFFIVFTNIMLTYLHNINLQDNAYKTGADELESVTK